MAQLQQFKTLGYVYRHGGVNAAAKALHLTPSAVSQQIKGLSNECGLTLMEREGRGVKLTDAGKMVARVGSQITSLWEQSIAQYNDRSGLDGGPRRPIRIGAFSSAIRLCVSAAALTGDDLSARIRLFETRPLEGGDLVQTGDLDAAVTLQDTRGVPGLHSILLHRDPFVLLGSPTSLASAVAGPKQLARMRWVLPREGSDCDRLITSHLESSGVYVDPVGRTDDWDLMQEMAARLHAIAYLPSSSVGQRSDLSVCERARGLPPLNRTITLVTRQGLRTDAWFLQLCQRLSLAYPRTAGAICST